MEFLMARPFHVYRLSDCMQQIGHCVGPMLIVPCNQDCRPGADPCAHQCLFDAFADLQLPIMTIHYRDLPDILRLHPGMRWGHALLMLNGRTAHHWPRIPSREELDAALAKLEYQQSRLQNAP